MMCELFCRIFWRDRQRMSAPKSLSSDRNHFTRLRAFYAAQALMPTQLLGFRF